MHLQGRERLDALGVQLFVAGFLGELISRSSGDRNHYAIAETIGIDAFFWYSMDEQRMGLIDVLSRKPRPHLEAWDRFYTSLVGKEIRRALSFRQGWVFEVGQNNSLTNIISWNSAARSDPLTIADVYQRCQISPPKSITKYTTQLIGDSYAMFTV